MSTSRKSSLRSSSKNLKSSSSLNDLPSVTVENHHHYTHYKWVLWFVLGLSFIGLLFLTPVMETFLLNRLNRDVKDLKTENPTVDFSKYNKTFRCFNINTWILVGITMSVAFFVVLWMVKKEHHKLHHILKLRN